MDFKEIFENIKEKILNLVNTIVDFYNENKKISLIILSSVVVVLLCIILLIVYAGNNKKNKEIVIPEPLILSAPLVIPDGPALPKDYNISRKTKDKWTEEEATEWFTIPSDKEINALSKSNDSLVNEIIGAAP